MSTGSGAAGLPGAVEADDEEGAAGTGWLDLPSHQRWLAGQAHHLWGFFQYRIIDPDGGFYRLGADGRPMLSTKRSLVETCRMTHCFALAALAGRPSAASIVEHGLASLETMHRDAEHGGYVWMVDGGPRPELVDPTKQAYGHAFVLLAATSAVAAGFPAGTELLGDITEVLEKRFWSEDDGLYAEEFSPEWEPYSDYRGQNSNMHLTEALMAAYAVTADPLYLERASRVAANLIGRIAAAHDWMVPEHYDSSWQPDFAYNQEQPLSTFRPYGLVPGHSVEWSRLLLQLGALDPAQAGWTTEAARRLFDRAMDLAWDRERTGLAYTVAPDGTLRSRYRYHWTLCEAVAAAAHLAVVTGDDRYRDWYQRLWVFIDRYLIDHEQGGWHLLLDECNRPATLPGLVEGKTDLYHALQCCLAPLMEPASTFAVGLRDRAWRAGSAGV